MKTKRYGKMAGFKLLMLMAGLALAIIISFSLITATDYYLLCPKDGEMINYTKCNPRMNASICDTSSDGVCSQCVYIGSTGNYCPAKDQCNSLGLSCLFLGNKSIDRTPPNATFTSPFNYLNYSTNRIKFTGIAEEDSEWFYLDNIHGDGLIKRMCYTKRNCNKTIIFKEGQNDITFIIMDKGRNALNETKTFFVDSTKPKITKTYPKKGEFPKGEFTAEIKEAYAKSLVLNYGNNLTGYRVANADLEDCRSLSTTSDRFSCTVIVNTSSYNGQSIYYWFNLTDKAESSVVSKQVMVNIDETAPVITNKGSLAVQLGRYVQFNINITETNLDELSYIDSYDGNSKILCSSLREGRCSKKLAFRLGHHELTIQATDKAGNLDYDVLVFDVV